MNDYNEGYRRGVEDALRHARVATDLVELIEGRLPALLAHLPPCGRCDGTGFLATALDGGSLRRPCPACGRSDK